MLKSILYQYYKKYKIKTNFAVHYILFAFLFCFTTTIVSQPKITWNLEPSPIYSNLKQLQIIDDTTLFALGSQIITLRGNSWQIMRPQPAAAHNLMYVLSDSAVWIAVTTVYQESKLFFYNGKKWEEVFNPLANTINSIRFKNEMFGAICGLGEIAVYHNGKWEYLNPPDAGNLKQINFVNDSTLLVLATKKGVFQYNSKVWKFIKGSQNAKILKVFNNKIYFIADSLLLQIEADTSFILSSNNLLNKVNSFDIFGNGNLTAVGDSGMILNYNDKIWSRQDSPVNYRLNSVKMLSDTSGWIVGNEGTILKYGSKINKSNVPGWKGFAKRTLYATAKMIDDEYGVVFDDFNNDGLVDIFTCGLFEANHLYINNGNGLLINESEKRGVSGLTKKESNELNLGACAGDLDNDGDDDLYVTVLNGGNKIYKNVGDGYFVDYSSISGGIGQKSDRTNSCAFADVDNDGDLDIFIANENSSNRLYLNNGAGIFNEETKKAGLQSAGGGTGCSFGDIDNDGDVDLYVGNWSRKNILYKNLLVESGTLLFEDITDTAMVGGKSFTKSNGVVFADIDNDADLDLFVTNRKTSNRLYINDGKGIFTDETEKLIGKDSLESYGAVIEDFNGDGARDIYLSNVGENIFYKNVANKYFKDKTIKYGAKISGYSTGSAAGDLDNDGDLDLYIANYVGKGSAILTNKLDSQKFIKLKLNGIENNRNGIGTKVYIYQDGAVDKISALVCFSEIRAGSGYASMNETVKTIPIPKYKYVSAKIIFPLGKVKIINHIKVGSVISISDVNGIKKYMLLVKQRFFKLIFDSHKLFELLKWIFIFVLIGYSSLRGYKRYDWTVHFIVISSLLLLTAYFIQHNYLEYENILFSTILPLTSVIITIVLLHLYYERERVKHVAAFEQAQIREKLSRDLHDDLASTISSIGIYLTLIKYAIKNDDGKIRKLIGKTEKLVGDASSSITDLIWAIKPRPESLANLLVRINENFASLFREKGIKFKSFSNIVGDDIFLESKIKQNVYLIIKESLNNILKYAEAKNVKVNFENKETEIVILIEDDGLGFNIDEAKTKGHGLVNMSKRAEEINAEFNIKSVNKKGTKIVLILKIT